jgi:hypothetical protein
MKKVLFVIVIFSFTLNKCKSVREAPSYSISDCLAVKLDYDDFFLKDTSIFFRQEYESYLKSKNTEFLYFFWDFNVKNSKHFLRIKQTENEIIAYKKHIYETKPIPMSNQEKETFSNLIKKINAGNYFQKCPVRVTGDRIYLILIKEKGVQKVTYFSPHHFPLQLNPDIETQNLYELFLLESELTTRSNRSR